MDILDNVATELGFEFHLYIVRDELFGAKYRNFKDWTHSSNKNKRNYGHESSTQKVGAVGGDGKIILFSQFCIHYSVWVVFFYFFFLMSKVINVCAAW